MKKTALTDKHIALGAKMAEFAGYNMPIVYSGINEEHKVVREGVGVFDVSHMGEFIVRGEGAFELVQKVTSNDVSKLEPNKAQYSCLPNDKGGIVDDLLVYMIGKDEYMLVVNASNIEKDWNWIKQHNSDHAEMINISDETTLLAVQGPKATATLQKLTEVNLDDIKFYTFRKGTFAGCENVLISATGYTGSGGFEIYFENKYADKIWDAIFEAGKEFDIKPIGLGARDTLRLEMGFCLYGNDIDDTTSPLEAGLGWITKLQSDDFVNKDYFVKQKEAGISKKLVGFEMIDKGIPRHDYNILNEGGETIGRVTSGTQAPTLQKAIGMGYVDKNFAEEGSNIFIEVRNKKLKAKVVKAPFYKG